MSLLRSLPFLEDMPAGALAPALSVGRALLPALALMACTGCADDPDPRHRTPPYLIAAEAYPDIRAPILIDDSTFYVEFGAAVLSEDDGAPVEIALYIDYGHANAAGHPYRNRAYPFEPILPGTLEDGPRTFEGKRWYLDSAPVALGCHTLTMMASHEFGSDICPADPADSDFLVWQVAKCDSDGGPCPPPCELTPCDDPCPSCPGL
jgi:hypothetical protein